MTPQQHDLLVSVICVFGLAAFSILFTWIGERSKKRTKQKQNTRFQNFDKNYESKKELDNKSETKRKGRVAILVYNDEPLKKEPENIDVARYSNRAVV